MQTGNKTEIDTRLGKNNILLLVPHAKSCGGNAAVSPLAVLSHILAEKLQCYTVINCRYKKSIIDLNDVRSIRTRKKIADGFLKRIKAFKEEISENSRLPLVLILQEENRKTDSEADILFGYGQGERGRKDRPHRPTMAPSLLSKIRMAAEDQGFRTELSGPETENTGRESYCLNQLFRQKNYVNGYYDPTVRSVVLTLSADLITDGDNTRETATRLANALSGFAEPMSLVRRISIDAIDIGSEEDFRYIFRLQGDSRFNDMVNEAYIDELARSIARNGLLHPLVLLQKTNGRYKILCGFRRYQATKRLGRHWVEAKVYNEEDFTTEDFFNISLAENTRRRNLNPVEIGNFLESAAVNLGLNNARLADRFGETLGIGRPGKKVSQSTIHKYRKLYQIRAQGESAEMISDVINDKLPFSIASEILAPIKDAEDRDSLYLEIFKPLAPSRAQLIRIKKLLAGIDPKLSRVIETPSVQQALKKSVQSGQPAATFLRILKKGAENRPKELEEMFEQKVDFLRKNIFGPRANRRDFNITSARKKTGGELTLHIRLKKQSLEQILEQAATLLTDKTRLEELLSLLK